MDVFYIVVLLFYCINAHSNMLLQIKKDSITSLLRSFNDASISKIKNVYVRAEMIILCVSKVQTPYFLALHIKKVLKLQ